MRPHSGAWLQPPTRRIAGLVMLNNVGIRWLNHLTLIRFNMSVEARDGTEALTCTYWLNTAYAPHDYKKDLRAIKPPLLLVVFTADKVFCASHFEPVISQYTSGQVVLLDGITHMGVVVDKAILSVLKRWLRDLKKA